MVNGQPVCDLLDIKTDFFPVRIVSFLRRFINIVDIQRNNNQIQISIKFTVAVDNWTDLGGVFLACKAGDSIEIGTGERGMLDVPIMFRTS